MDQNGEWMEKNKMKGARKGTEAEGNGTEWRLDGMEAEGNGTE